MREHELGIGEHEGEEAGGGHRRQRQRHRDAQERLKPRAAVDHRRLEQLLRHLAEEDRKDQHGEGQRPRRMHRG